MERVDWSEAGEKTSGRYHAVTNQKETSRSRASWLHWSLVPTTSKKAHAHTKRVLSGAKNYLYPSWKLESLRRCSFARDAHACMFPTCTLGHWVNFSSPVSELFPRCCAASFTFRYGFEHLYIFFFFYSKRTPSCNTLWIINRILRSWWPRCVLARSAPSEKPRNFFAPLRALSFSSPVDPKKQNLIDFYIGSPDN